MQNESKNGIVCDNCGTEYVYRFTYISADIYVNDKLEDSKDLCQICFDSIYKNIKTISGKCELCGENIIDHSIRVNFDEVEVDLQKFENGGTKIHRNILILNICPHCKNKFFYQNRGDSDGK